MENGSGRLRIDADIQVDQFAWILRIGRGQRIWKRKCRLAVGVDVDMKTLFACDVLLVRIDIAVTRDVIHHIAADACDFAMHDGWLNTVCPQKIDFGIGVKHHQCTQ